jgi:hypothetical protein
MYIFFVSSVASLFSLAPFLTLLMNALEKHIRSCRIDGCGCRTFYKCFKSWAAKLPVAPGADADDTWLWFNIDDQAKFRWMCVVCDGEAYLQGCPEQSRKGDNPQMPKLSHLLVHHDSTRHRENVAKMFGTKSAVEYVAPSKQLFVELFNAFQAGTAPTGGYELPSGRLAVVKANNMLWCLDQGLCDIRLDVLAHAETINILRDERHGRMHVRMRASTDTSEVPFVGYLGQSRGHRPDSIGIAAATVAVFRNACWTRANPPAGAEVEPQFHLDIFDHARRAVEAVSVDSAENEVVAVSDMSRKKDDGSEADFPNCNTTLRDAAHSARRLLSRLFHADSVLDFVFQFFMVLTSIIQWSDEMRALYGDCTRVSTDKAVSTCFSHLRAAKHRIESWFTPLSRCCLDPSGWPSLSR